MTIKEIAERFRSTYTPILLGGGHGTTYRAGDIVLSPVSSEINANWLADTFSLLSDNEDVRIPCPIKSLDGKWVEDGYSAWTYLDGDHEIGRYSEKLKACDAYHSILVDVPRPDFLGSGHDPWSTAEKVAWQEINPEYDEDFMAIIGPILKSLTPLKVSSQMVHGDMVDNFLFKDTLPPAVIDFSPTWRPVGFAKGIMFIDAITWHGPSKECVNAFKNVPDILQYTLRAALRRIVEQPEQVIQLGKGKVEALELAQEYNDAIQFIMSELKN